MSDVFPEYAYSISPTQIATVPVEPRDSARVFVYDSASDTVVFDVFRNLAVHVPAPALLILNDTKVVPARLILRKPTGGKVGALLLVNEWSGNGPVPALLDVFVPGGMTLISATGEEFVVVGHNGPIFYLDTRMPPDTLNAFLFRAGETPVPPYIKGVSLSESELRARYQTIFANAGTSVAAPTASLHFTPGVFSSLEEKGVQMARIALHVGLGTFASVTKEQLMSGRLHVEPVVISDTIARTIADAKKIHRPIIAAGTTTVRAVESAAAYVLAGKGVNTSTDLFIRPGFSFSVVDALITNFHVPQSSLMALVDAFLLHKGARRRIMSLYQIALSEGFRFFSFGDAMLIK